MGYRLVAGIAVAVMAMSGGVAFAQAVGPADRAAALKAAGGKVVDRESGQTCDVSIEADGVKDLNGDGLPEIVVTGRGTFCYGSTEQGYWVLQKTPAGAWKIVDQNQGVPTFLPTRGVGGWQDIEVGGPGFCFPINRYNGKEYVLNGTKEYQRGACARR